MINDYCKILKCPMVKLYYPSTEKGEYQNKNHLAYSICYKTFYCDLYHGRYEACRYLTEDMGMFATDGDRLRAVLMAKSFIEDNNYRLLGLTYNKEMTLGGKEYRAALLKDFKERKKPNVTNDIQENT